MAGVAFFSLALSIALLIHHKIKHSNPNSDLPYTCNRGEFIQDSCEQWFQTSDVGNVASHECWVIVFTCHGLIWLFVLIIYSNAQSC